MALSLQQVHKQTQQLIMTPQMQQSIQLLQMNTQELEQLTQTELEENPFLQLDEDRDEEEAVSTPDAVSDQPAAEAGVSGETAPDVSGDLIEHTPEERNGADHEEDFLAPVEREILSAAEETLAPVSESLPLSLNGSEPPPPEPAETTEDSEEVGSAAEAASEGSANAEVALEQHPEQFDQVDVSWDDYYDDAENAAYGTKEDEEERDFTEYTAARISLYEHLMWQLRLSTLEDKAAEVGEYFVGCIDDDGYLPAEAIEEAKVKFGIDQAEAERILAVIQEFEPTGVGSRTPAECLLIQMKALGSYSELARQVIEGHFEDLERKKFRPIARALNVEEDQILDLYHKVGRLEPRPGRQYTTDSPHYIEPDVVVKLFDGNLSIYVNEGRSSQLSINQFYRRMLRMQAKALTKEEKNYAVDKFRNALMLIKNIEKRKSTILRVTEAIMEVQRDFLDKGVEALKPLTLREVADMVGMHESTVARVTSKKYVETPQGVFSLKYFFSSGINKSSGPAAMGGSSDAVSSRAIKDKLAELIEKEDPKHPLSDQKIAETLNREGFDIARRTVAKYREQMKILPAKLRRKA